MKFKIVTKEVVAALKTIQGVTGNSIVTITAKGKGLRLASQGKTNMLSIRVPATVEEPGTMSLESYMFSQTIKNRAEVSIELADSQVLIKGKSLSVRLVSAPVEEVAALEKKDGQEIDAEIQYAFSDCVARIGISNVHDQNPIGYRVVMDKKGLSVVAADQHHMASAVHSGVKSKTRVAFTIAAEAFSTISSIAGKEPYSLVFTDSEILAWAAGFELRIPTLADDNNGPSEEAVASMLSSIAEAKPKILCSVDSTEFYSVLDTMQGIFEGGANVSLTSKEAGMVLKFVTSYGEISSTVKAAKAKGTFKHQIDLPLTRDTFAFVKGKTLNFGIHNDNVLFCTETVGDIACTYLMTLVTQ